MADVPVLYRFIATGQDSVTSAFKGILATAQSTSKGVAAAVQQTERVAKAARGSTGGRSPADKAAKDQERALTHVAKIRDRYFAEQQRAEEKAAQAKVRAQEQAMAKIARMQAAHERAEAKKQERANEKLKKEWGQAAIGGLGRIASVAKYAAIGVGLSSAGIIGQAAREGMQLQDVANRLSIASRGAGEKAVDPTALRREFEAAALANPGVKATDVAAGAAGFVAKTGELGMARQFAGTFATVASASGASVEDISNAAADLFQKFDIKTIDGMRDALAALTYQGKAGAFEIKDAASQFAKMSAAASRFGVTKGAEGVKILGGLTQIARSTTGGPEQAATAVEAVFRQLIAKSKDIKTLGVDVFEKGSKSKTRDVRDIIVETIAKAKGGQAKLQQIFDTEGIRGISPLVSAYNEASGKTVGTDAEKNAAGIAAMRAALAKAIDAPGDWAEVVKDAAQAQGSASAQLDAAWESIKAAVSREAVPALQRIGPAVQQVLPSVLNSIAALAPAFDLLGASISRIGDLVKDLQSKGVLPAYEDAARERAKAGAKEELAKTDPRAVAARVDMLAATGMDAIDAMTGANSRGPAGSEGAGEAQRAAGVDFWSTHDDNAQNRALFNSIMTGGNAASDAYGMAQSFLSSTPFGMMSGAFGETDEQAVSRKALAGSVSASSTDAQLGNAGAAELKAAAAELKNAARAMQENGRSRGGSIVAD